MTLPVPDKQNREAITFWLTISAATTPIFVAVAMLWLKANLVTRVEYEALSKTVSEHTTIFAVMRESDKRNDRQDSTLADHEARLRFLEMNPKSD
jgi:hypothetical protein